VVLGVTHAWEGLGGVRHGRIAIAHDYLTQRGGAERVVLAMARAFPDAVIHTMLYDPDATYPEFRELDIVSSRLNRIPPFRHYHRAALPLLAPAAASMHIDADVVLASSSGWAHGFRTKGSKVIYCHNPARWLYQTQDYLGSRIRRSVPGILAFPFLSPLRTWDQRAARSADRYLANSTVVRDRIRGAYDIDAEVIHPPVGIDPTGTHRAPAALADWADSGFHLVVSRLLPYKNVEHVVDAFRGRRARLVVVGSGPLRPSLVRRSPTNVRFVQGLTDAELRWVYDTCRVLVAASHEDFGLTPCEAMTFGKPVLALRAGGYLDSVREGVVGSFFDRIADLPDALDVFRPEAFDPALIRAHAEQFGEPAFADRLRQVVSAELAAQDDLVR
jgi:glycosyltransferase involved in cell wall biosynthesis